MRAVILSVMIVLALAHTARADASLQGFGPVWRDVHVVFAEPYPEWTFFVLCHDSVRQLPTTTEEVSLTELTEEAAYWRRRLGVSLCAVPNEVLAESGSLVPNREWFAKNGENSRLRWASIQPKSGFEGASGKYRVRLTPIVMELEPQEWAVSPCVWMAGSLLFVVVSVLCVRLARRQLRRKPLT